MGKQEVLIWLKTFNSPEEIMKFSANNKVYVKL